MINLFNNVYLQLDNYIASTREYSRIIFSDRDFKIPFPKYPNCPPVPGVLDVIPDDVYLIDRYGSFEGFLSYLALNPRKVVIVVSQENLARMMITQWKSIFKNPEPQAMWELFKMHIANFNLFTALFKRHEDIDGLQDDVQVTPMDYQEFLMWWENTSASSLFKAMPATAIPVEYYLATYFGGEITREQRDIFFEKTKRIVLTNIIGLLDNDRQHFIRYSHNHYLVTGEDPMKAAADPMVALRNTESLSWLFDEKFNQANVAYVKKTYGLSGLKKIFQAYNTLFAGGKQYYELEPALDYLIDSDVAGMLVWDVEDENANIYAEREFINKLNGLFISYVYRLARHGRVDEIKRFQLA